MRDPDNVEALLKLSIDFIGFIHYPKSKRFVEPGLNVRLDRATSRTV